MLEQVIYDGSNCIAVVARWNDIPFDVLNLVLEYALQYADVKKLMENQDKNRRNWIFHATSSGLRVDSFKLLLETSASQHADMKSMLENQDNDGCDCIITAVIFDFPADSLRLLLEFCVRYADLKSMLESRDKNGRNCIELLPGERSEESLQVLLDFASQHAD